MNGVEKEIVTDGSGRLDAVSNAISSITGLDYVLESYTQHALEGSASSKAASYVSIKYNDNIYWGTGISHDIIKASVRALVSAVNRLMDAQKNK